MALRLIQGLSVTMIVVVKGGAGVASWLPNDSAASLAVYWRTEVTGELALPPADEVTVTCEGADMLGNVAVKVPATGGEAGPITAVHGLPVAWLISFSVQV